MIPKLQQVVAMLLVCATCRAPPVIAAVRASNAKPPQRASALPVYSLRVDVWDVGSVAAGCSLCRNSGNCSVAMNDTSSGVFCGDLHAADTQPCCCPYYTECRVTSTSKTCECGGSWLPTHHERLSVTVPRNETETLVQDSFPQEVDDPMNNQMSVSTEILIHISAYLALIVFALYVDQWVEYFSDFRRNQMVAYIEAVDMKLLRFRQRIGKRRHDSRTDTETDDNVPLLVLESPAPTPRPAFTFEEVPDTEVDDIPYEIDEENEAASKELVVVTVPADVI